MTNKTFIKLYPLKCFCLEQLIMTLAMYKETKHELKGTCLFCKRKVYFGSTIHRLLVESALQEHSKCYKNIKNME